MDGGLTPEQQRRIAEGVKSGDAKAIKKLLEAFEPLMKSLVAKASRFLNGHEDVEDLSGEMVIWTVELTEEWDPEIRHLDGYLKQFLGWKVLDHLDWQDDDQPRPRPVSEYATDDDDGELTGSSDIEEQPPGSTEVPDIERWLSCEQASAIVEDVRARIDSDYLMQILNMKLAEASNRKIAEALGVNEKKIRNDWSRRILKPIFYPVLRKHRYPKQGEI